VVAALSDSKIGVELLISPMVVARLSKRYG
jgi:hypothetical protein